MARPCNPQVGLFVFLPLGIYTEPRQRTGRVKMLPASFGPLVKFDKIHGAEGEEF